MDATEMFSRPDDGNQGPSGPDESTANGIQARSSVFIHRNEYQRLSRSSLDTTDDARAEELDGYNNTTAPSDISTTPRRDSTTSATESIHPMLTEHRPNVHPSDNTQGETIALTAFTNDKVRMVESPKSRPLKGTGVTGDEDPIDSAPGTAPAQTSSTNEAIWRIWGLEIMSSLLALGCIAAIAIVLFLRDRKPLPDWPALISVNSLVAIFTALFKASLIMPIAEGLGQLKWNWFHQPRNLADIVLFDDASRGPWGCLLLIIKQLPRPQKAYLAGLGSVITIAALAIDPISQAMIEHRECHTPRSPGVAETSEIPRTNNYTASRTPYPSLLEWAIDPVMEAALNKGLIDPEKIETQLKFRCTTGNCTFGQEDDGYFFSSLAMCHSCQDMTERVTEEEVKGPSGKYRTWYLSIPDEHGGPALGPHVFSDQSSPKLSVTKTSSRVYGNSQPFLSYDALMITLPRCKEDSKDCTFSNTATIAPVAARCQVQPCVKRYRGRVTNGIYSEEDERSSQLLKRGYTSGYNEEIAFGLVTDSSLVDGEEKKCAATADWARDSVRADSAQGLLYRTGYIPDGDKIAWKSYPQECVWAVGYTTAIAIGSVLRGLLEQNITSVTQAGSHPSAVAGPIWLKRAYADSFGNISTVDEMFRGLATSMTAAIRNNPGDSYADWPTMDESQRNLRRATGTTSNMETCIYVHWGWIAYPASLLVLQWIFSVLVLVSQRPIITDGIKRNRTTWKWSPLALLFHGLDEDLRKNNGNPNSLEGMGELAKRVNVQLAPASDIKDQGWRFYQT